MPRIRLETIIFAPVAACFDLSLSVEAHAASMGPSGERAISGVQTGMMKLHDSVTWRARHFGVPFRMTSVISEYDRPARFVDEQQRGPFREWRHEHRFSEPEPGSTLMIDEVFFRSPLGPLGVVAERLMLNRYMPHLLRQRNGWLKAVLENMG